MKTVLLISPSLGIGGAEKIAINTANCLKERYHVKLVLFQRKDVEYDYEGEVICLSVPARKGKIAKVWNQTRRILKLIALRWRLKADAAISFGQTANLTNAVSGLFSRGKTVSAIHGFGSVTDSVLLKCTLRFSDSVICIAQAMQEGLLKIFPWAKNTVVVENGYDVESVIAASHEVSDTPNDSYTLISMGRLSRVKRFDRLIKAVALAKKEREDLRLVLLGKGELLESLQSLCRDEGVEDSVSFLGYRKNPYSYLRQADLYVMSSQSEGFPNALIEALACELPIVSVDCLSGPREILSKVYTGERIRGIVEEEYGVLVEDSASDEEVVRNLATAILMLANDSQRTEQYRSRGIERAKCFDLSAYQKKMIALIESKK